MTDSLELIRVAGIHAAVQSPDVAHLVIGLNEVISSRTVPGLDVQPEPTAEGVRIVVRVAAGAVIAHPVHMCFGLVQERGVQKIDLDLAVGDGGRLGVIAHCVFPAAVDVQHLMDADIRVGRDAHYSYSERHIHSETGGVNVVPKARVALAENARYRTDFELLAGRVGRIAMDYETTCAAGSVLEMTARIKARADDEVRIRETGYLDGENARGVLTSRVAVSDRATAQVYNKLTASAAGARGHVDCKEIIRGDGTVSAVPIVEVRHPKAHVTHEAALGSVDTKQLETLMARGLSEDEASDVIIDGLLR